MEIEVTEPSDITSAVLLTVHPLYWSALPLAEDPKSPNAVHIADSTMPPVARASLPFTLFFP